MSYDSDRTNKPMFSDAMDGIKKERKRLEKAVQSKEFQGKPFWAWMPRWLAKSDEQHLKEAKLVSGCQVCGRKVRFSIYLGFSFCDEYGCGMHICYHCLKKMLKLYKGEIRKRNCKGREVVGDDTAGIRGKVGRHEP